MFESVAVFHLGTSEWNKYIYDSDKRQKSPTRAQLVNCLSRFSDNQLNCHIESLYFFNKVTPLNLLNRNRRWKWVIKGIKVLKNSA